MLNRFSFIILAFVLMLQLVKAQQLPSNEKVVFSFNTLQGKTVQIAKDKNDTYLVYRCYNKGKLELEYPNKDTSSWRKFTYSYYLRPGGKMNDGLDLNYLAFTIEKTKYVVYSTYSASEEKTYIGVRILEENNELVKDIAGKIKTQKGTLIDFRDEEKVLHSDGTYD